MPWVSWTTPPSCSGARCTGLDCSPLDAGAEVNAAGDRSPDDLYTQRVSTAELRRWVCCLMHVPTSMPPTHTDRRLHWACKCGSQESVALLLKNAARPDACTSDGSTPLHVACEAAAGECVAMLVRAGADASASNAHRVQPLHSASAVGDVRSVRLLLESGVDANAELHFIGKHDLSSLAETYTKTALYLAAENGHATVVQCLLEHKANAGARGVVETDQGITTTTALWIAKRGGHDAVCSLLLDAGAEDAAETLHSPSPPPSPPPSPSPPAMNGTMDAYRSLRPSHMPPPTSSGHPSTVLPRSFHLRHHPRPLRLRHRRP